MIRWIVSLLVLVSVACAARPTQTPSNALVSGTPAVSAEADPKWAADVAAVPVSAQAPSLGPSLAPVTVVVYSDLQCPYCRRYEETLQQARELYGADALRVVWKNSPLDFHSDARPAAELLMGAYMLGGNEAFWKLQRKVFANQGELNADGVLRWAGELGLDTARLAAGLEAHEWKKHIDEDVAEARRLGVSGTPTSFINGIRVGGAVPLEYVRGVVDAEQSEIVALQKAGTRADEIYARRTAANFGADKAKDEDDDDRADATIARVPLGTSPIRGNLDAPVTLVVFSDYECPFCKRVEPTLTALLAKYGSKLRVVWKDQPLAFHKRARRAAMFAREARAQKGDVGFWAAHDKLFEISPDLDKPDLEAAARALGLNLAKIQAAVRTGKYEPEIEEDLALAETVRSSGTPHSFINGRRLSGAASIERFSALIDEELKKAEAMIAAGVAPGAVYAKVMEGAAPEPALERRTLAAPSTPAPRRGAANAKVVITELADFQCPFCARVEPTIDALLKHYGDRIAVVARDMPLPMHPQAQIAAEAAREAFAQKGNAGYWKMRALLYSDRALERADLERYAKQSGLDLPRFRKALDGHLHAAAIEEDKKAADAAGISGTPAFVINGYFVSGAQSELKFRRVIDRALLEAGVTPPTARAASKGEAW